MNMTTIEQLRQKIGNRIAAEMRRKAVRTEQISGVDASVVEEYLAGRREISFDELRPICQAIGLDMMLLLSPNYQPPRVIYRSVGRAFRRQMAEIETTMALVAEWLPKPQRPWAKRPPEDITDANELISYANNAVEALKTNHYDIPALFEAHRLPVLAIQMNEDAFDACLLHIGDRFLVVLNQCKPQVRQAFSLLHEFAHFLFDADRDLPVDVDLFASDFYQDTIRQEVRHEYLANKFAQLWLVPWETAEELAKVWNKPELFEVSRHLFQHPISPDVLAHAVYDVLRQRPGRVPTFTAIRDRLRELRDRLPAADSLDAFLQRQKHALTRLLLEHQDDFSPERWMQITRAWQLDITTS